MLGLCIMKYGCNANTIALGNIEAALIYWYGHIGRGGTGLTWLTCIIVGV